MINGSVLRDAFISGANQLWNKRKATDALNVFPVPDGDTGTNMSMTMAAAVRELELMDDHATAEEVAQAAASSALRGARGNSGVILSLLFRGLSKGLAGKKAVSPADMAAAFELGVEAAYKAVMKPTEGTILTVARLSAAKAHESAGDGDDMPTLFEKLLATAKTALEDTPNLLPVLKKAGVVDAGGFGYVLILEGFLSVIRDGAIIAKQDGKQPEQYVDDHQEIFFQGEITFTYCTEFIIDKEGSPDVSDLRSYLESIGDSVVVVEDENIVKCHAHTDNPGDAIQKALGYGSLSKIKIDNMREQYAEELKKRKTQSAAAGNPDYQPVDHSNEFGFVSVSSGEGFKNLFLDLGVNQVVTGGQTMNPSTDDILAAIHATPSKTVFVLPNNKNIIMAAEQAAKLADRAVIVLQSTTLAQGISGMLAFNPDASADENATAMTKAFDKVDTGLVTFAARDSEFDGRKIKQGEIMALENGKIIFVSNDLLKTTVRMIGRMVKKNTAFVTIYTGEDVTGEMKEQLEAEISGKFGDNVEVNIVEGGQPVYYFIIAAEAG